MSTNEIFAVQIAQICKPNCFFFANCDVPGRCKTCTNLIRWLVPILKDKWDTFRFIDFDQAMYLTKSLRFFVDESSTIVKYYRMHRNYIKKFCKKTRRDRPLDQYHIELLCMSNFFKLGNDEYLRFRNFILRHIVRRDEIYSVNCIPNDLLLSLFQNHLLETLVGLQMSCWILLYDQYYFFQRGKQ